MAQLVEHHLAKVRVASSNLVVRSIESKMCLGYLITTTAPITDLYVMCCSW